MKKFGLTLAIIGALNFIAFGIMNSIDGGSASNGKVENGVYYLSDHGKYIPTSETVFRRSRFHSMSVWVTHPLAFLGIIIFGALKTEDDEAKALQQKRPIP